MSGKVLAKPSRPAWRIALSVLAGIAIALFGLWATMALWFRFPGPEVLRGAAAAAFAALSLVTLSRIVWRGPRLALPVFVAASAALLIWWSTLTPNMQADFSPDVARQVTGKIEGDLLTLTNVRNFDWRSETDITERWETRTFDLSKLKTLDVFLSYWAGPTMAHFIVSFGFEDGRFLAWSVEVRRTRGNTFSPIGDLFRSNPLIIVAAEERDVIGVRTNVRGEDVQRYRLNFSPAAMRKMLVEYVEQANALAARPAFYNSLTSNCTTFVIRMARAIGADLPFDWRLIVNGYLPEYAFEKGLLEPGRSLESIKTDSHIRGRALKEGLTERYSPAIRAL